ncbi:hypothetical protein CspHIS471_0100800 [Cutaneotrichosporon sp. HIS471]|nr:hypothetical protein CspHIS471_0100800 [Cutaneotrichosporon sp. HIS471]
MDVDLLETFDTLRIGSLALAGDTESIAWSVQGLADLRIDSPDSSRLSNLSPAPLLSAPQRSMECASSRGPSQYVLCRRFLHLATAISERHVLSPKADEERFPRSPSHPDSLSTRFILGPGTPLQHTRNARRFLFYPVPDCIMVADLRVALTFRLGPVESIRVIDGLADVRFSAQLGHEALRYLVPVPLHAADALEDAIRRNVSGFQSIHVGGGFARVLFSGQVGFRALNFFHQTSINGVRLHAWALPLSPIPDEGRAAPLWRERESIAISGRAKLGTRGVAPETEVNSPFEDQALSANEVLSLRIAKPEPAVTTAAFKPEGEANSLYNDLDIEIADDADADSIPNEPVYPTFKNYSNPSKHDVQSITPPRLLSPAFPHRSTFPMHRRNSLRTLSGRPPKPFFASTTHTSPWNKGRPPFSRVHSSPSPKCPAAAPVLFLQPSSPELTVSPHQYPIETHNMASPPRPLLHVPVAQLDHQPAFAEPIFIPPYLSFWSPPKPPIPRPVPIIPPPPGYRESRVPHVFARLRARNPLGSSPSYQLYPNAVGGRSINASPDAPPGTPVLGSTPSLSENERTVFIRYRPGSVAGSDIGTFLRQKLGIMDFKCDDYNGLACAVLAEKHGRLAKPQLHNYARVKKLTLSVAISPWETRLTPTATPEPQMPMPETLTPEGRSPFLDQDPTYRSPEDTSEVSVASRSTSYAPSRVLSPLQANSTLEPIGLEDLHLPSITPILQESGRWTLQDWRSFNPPWSQFGLPGTTPDSSSSLHAAMVLTPSIGNHIVNQMISPPQATSNTESHRSLPHRPDRPSYAHHDRGRRSHYVGHRSHDRPRYWHHKLWSRRAYRMLPLEQRITDSYRPATFSRDERTALIGPLPSTLSRDDLTSFLLRRVGVIEHLSVKNDVAKVVFQRAHAKIARRKLHDVLIDSRWRISVVLPELEDRRVHF